MPTTSVYDLALLLVCDAGVASAGHLHRTLIRLGHTSTAALLATRACVRAGLVA